MRLYTTSEPCLWELYVIFLESLCRLEVPLSPSYNVNTCVPISFEIKIYISAKLAIC